MANHLDVASIGVVKEDGSIFIEVFDHNNDEYPTSFIYLDKQDIFRITQMATLVEMNG